MMQEHASDLYEDLENWMAKLPPKLRDVPINLIAIPGSHDSMTSSITFRSRLAPDAEKFMKRLRFLGPLLRTIMARWSKTQDFDLTEQLLGGIRYFDLRVAPKKCVDAPFFVHGLYADEVPIMLSSLHKFLESHPREFVILDFQHFYEFSDDDHKALSGMLKTTLGDKLTPYRTRMNHLTLENLTDKLGHQVLVMYRSCAADWEHMKFLWPSSSIPTPWPQTICEEELFKKLDEGVTTRSFTHGYVSQCVLTPTNWFVTKHLFSNLKKQCAKPVHESIIIWLQKQKIGIGGINIVISDFIDLNDNKFAKEVIGVNAKFLHNSLLSASNLTPVEN